MSSPRESIARAVVAEIQQAVDDAIGTRRPDPLLRLFSDPAAVVIGTSAYRAGTAAVRDYFSALATESTVVRWHLDDPDVFLSEGDLIGFSADGEVEWADGQQSGRDPVRMTIVARRQGQDWSVLHFHGSISEQ